MIGIGATGPMAATIAPRAAAPAAKGGFDWRVLLSALSSAAGDYADSKANNQAQDDLLAGNAALFETQQRADKMLGDEIASVAKSSPRDEEAAALRDYSASIARQRAAQASPAPGPTLGGQAARADQKAADAAGAQYAREQATLTAGIDAPIRQREGEGIRANRTAGDVAALRQEAGTSAFLAKLRANRRVPNPWVKLVSQLGGQIANNYEPG